MWLRLKILVEKELYWNIKILFKINQLIILFLLPFSLFPAFLSRKERIKTQSFNEFIKYL